MMNKQGENDDAWLSRKNYCHLRKFGHNQPWDACRSQSVPWHIVNEDTRL